MYRMIQNVEAQSVEQLEIPVDPEQLHDQTAAGG
jgi:hypothetical protein